MRDYGLEAHRAAEAHLEALWEAEHQHDLCEAESGDVGDVVDVVDAAGPFCGCETCIIREVLHAAWPLMLEHAKEELRREGEAGTAEPSSPRSTPAPSELRQRTSMSAI